MCTISASPDTDTNDGALAGQDMHGDKEHLGATGVGRRNKEQKDVCLLCPTA
jgi:hypothetical protein